MTRELSPSNNPNYTTFFQGVETAAKCAATTVEKKAVDWFEMSKEKIQPVIDKMYNLLAEYRNSTGEGARIMKEELKLASKIRSITINEAKATYLSAKAEEIGNLAGGNTKEMWVSVREMELGNTVNHVQPKKMALRLPNGERAKNDKENMSIMHPHCMRVFNNHKIVSPQALDLLTQREQVTSLDNPITWKEFMKAITGLKNDKSPGLNGIPAEAFKAMDRANLEKVFNFIVDYWNGDKDYEE
jgi:hypothetical protein